MMMTPSENVCSRVFSEFKISGACRPDARERHGDCLLAGGIARQKQSGPSKQPSAQRVISGGETRVDQPSEGRKKKTTSAQNMFQLSHRQSPVQFSERVTSFLSVQMSLVTFSETIPIFVCVCHVTTNFNGIGHRSSSV